MTDLMPRGYNAALAMVVTEQTGSTSMVQRKLKVGYNHAAAIVEALETNGVLTKPDHAGRRKVLIKSAEAVQERMMPEEEPKPATDHLEAAMGHNSREAAPLLDGVSDALTETAREKLRLTVERIERLEEEKKEVAEQIKEVYGEAKALGYDTKALRQVVKLRKTDRQDRQEFEAILEVYLDALGEL